MEEDLAKRFMTPDSKFRLSIYREEWAENPRYNTDEPLHCEDFSRNYTIMVKDEKAKCDSMQSRLTYMLREYGDYKKIMDVLFENGKHMTDGKAVCHDALVYDRSTRCWKQMYYGERYNSQTNKFEMGWRSCDFHDCKRDEIDAYDIIDGLEKDSVDYMIEHCMTDKIKMASYSFGYYGSISFSDSVDCGSNGVAWLEKDEFLKYSGCDEARWSEKKLTEIEFLCDEIEAWADGNVYGYVLEERKDYKVHRECLSHDEPAKDFVESEWNETDSCWGYYGKLDNEHVIAWILDAAGYKLEELEEVNEAA